MDIFGKKGVKALREELQTMNKSLEEKIEKKGYYESPTNQDNEYLKQVLKFANEALRLVDFSEVNRMELVNYFKKNAVVRGIIDTTIASAVAELVDYIELVDKNKKVIDKHWALDVLNKPNDLENKRKFVKAWAINRLITGDAFVYGLEGIGLSKGTFTELYVMPSQYVEIITGGLTNPIKGYKVTEVASLEARLTPKNVMFSRDYNPDIKTYYGLSKLYSAAYMVQLLDKADKRQNTSMENGGVNTLITPKPDSLGSTTATQTENIRKEMNQNKKSNYNAFLPEAVEVHKVGDTPVDLQVLEASKYAINALCFVYGISVDTFLAQAKYENSKEAKKQVYEGAAIPLMNEFLEDFTSFCKLKDEKFILNTDKIEILKKSPLDQMSVYDKAYMSINERREYLGFPKIKEPYADLPVIPMGVSLGDPNAFDFNEGQVSGE